MSKNIAQTGSLPHFMQHQTDFIAVCAAHGMSDIETARSFVILFPGFGEGRDPKSLEKLIAQRVANFKHNHPDKVVEVANSLSESDYSHIPIARVDFKLRFLQDLLFNPPENCAVLLRILESADKIIYRVLGGKKESAVKTKDFAWEDIVSKKSILAQKPAPNVVGSEPELEVVHDQNNGT